MTTSFDPYHRWLGIPPKQQPPDHYRLLGIERFESDVEVIRDAADRQMAHVRTYQLGEHSALSQEILNELAAANVCLLNPEKKAAYDEQLRARLAGKALSPLTQVSSRAAVIAAPRSPTPYPHVTENYWWANGGMALAVFFAVGAGVGLMFIIWWLSGPLQNSASQLLVTEADSGGSRSATGSPPPPPPPPPRREPQLLHADAGFHTDHAPATDPDDGTDTRNDNGPDGLAYSLDDAQASEDGPDDAPDDDPASDFPPVPPPPTKAVRKPVPALSERQEIRRMIDDIYPEPQNAHEASELANKLAALADATEHPTEWFVLLQRASELASKGGDVRGMLALVDRLAERFEIDLWTVKASFLRTAAKRDLSTTQRRELAEQMLKVAEQALDSEAFAGAAELAKLALTEGGRLRDREIVAWSREGSEQVAAAAQVFSQAQDARASLIDSPNDPEANLVMGSYLSFFKGDWRGGLAHLANGSNPPLRQLAQQEVAAATGQLTAVAPMELADGWWELARNADSHRGAMLLRAGYWYQQAIDGTEPETLKTTVDRRLHTIDKETSIPSLRRRHRGHHLMVKFNDQASAHKHLDWNGQWRMTNDGGKAERISRSFVRTRQAYAGNLRIIMDFSLGRCRYSNTGQCTINVWDKSVEVSGRRQWRGLRARVFIYRGGNNIVFVLNDKVQRIPLTPEMWAKPTTVSVHWRHRESHFRLFELSAETVCAPHTAGATAFFEPSRLRNQTPWDLFPSTCRVAHLFPFTQGRSQ